MEPEVPRPAADPGGSLRHRAARGAIVVGIRGLASRIIALAGTVVLARQLSAEEFGVFALGVTLMISIATLVQAGLGAGLIRRVGAPSQLELQTVVAVNGILIVLAVGVTAVVCAVIGGLAMFVALMVALMPLTAFRTPGVIVFERALSYRKLAEVEIMETVAMYGLGALLVVAGLGLIGIVVAAAVRVIGGTVLMIHASPVGIVRPRLSVSVVRDLARFASRFQGMAIVNFLRDQGVNVGITVIGGVATTGVYHVASRVLQAPQILLEALFRVSFPAMSRLKEHGEDAQVVVERTLKAVALGLGAIVAPLAAASVPMIVTVFGERWREAATVIPPVCLALMIGGPVAVAAAGYLFAVDAGDIPLKSALLHTVAWFAIALPLLGPLGVVAVGLGTLGSGTVEAVMLGRGVRKRTGARVVRALITPLFAATAGAGVGAAAIALVSLSPALEATIATIVALGSYMTLLFALQRPDLKRLARLVRGAARPVIA